MTIRVGIVGFGRIGRSLFRLGHDLPGIEFVAVCDEADPASLVYLLNHSTVEGAFEPQATLEGNRILCAGRETRLLGESTPGHIPWDAMGVDVVLECTGRFRNRDALQLHLDAGAHWVILSTPPVDAIDYTLVAGINEDQLTGEERIVSCGSSSVHALALTAKLLHEAGTIRMASMTTVHAYTGDQQLSDVAKPGLRWSRSAAQNIIPNATWAPQVVETLLPELAGRIDGLSLNVPVAAGSNIDLTVQLEKLLTAEQVNRAVEQAARERYVGLIRYTEEPIVSIDVVGDTHSAIFDAAATLSLGNGMVKTLTWFDNGWAYAARMLEAAQLLAKREQGRAS